MNDLEMRATGIKFIPVLDRKTAAIVFPDIKRNTVRLLFQYNNERIAILWMQVRPDGSFLMNERCKHPKEIYKASGLVVEKGEAVLSDSRSIEVDEGATIKMTHHSSGRLNAYRESVSDEKIDAIRFRDIEKLTLFREVQYKDFNKYEIIQKRRATDIVVPNYDMRPFQIVDGQALHVRVFVNLFTGESCEMSADKRNQATDRVTLIFPFLDLINCKDLVFQIEFFTAPPRTDYPWSSTTSVLIP